MEEVFFRGAFAGLLVANGMKAGSTVLVGAMLFSLGECGHSHAQPPRGAHTLRLSARAPRALTAA